MTNNLEKVSSEVTSVEVFGLFGQHNHRINLNSDGLTLVHGPNGVGKTSLLKLIGYAIDVNVDELANCIFDKFVIQFSGDRCLTVERETSEPGVSQESLFDESELPSEELETRPREDGFATELRFRMDCVGGESSEWIVQNSANQRNQSSRSRMMRQMRETRPWITRIGPDRWINERTSEVLSTDEVLELQSFGLSGLDLEAREKFLKTIPRIPVETIQSQRLVVTRSRDRTHPTSRSDVETLSAVQFHAEEMSGLIRRTFHLSANVSQNLDRTFAHRVLTSDESITQSGESLREIYGEQLGVWTRIKDAGMLPDSNGRSRIHFARFPQTQLPEQLSLPDDLDDTQKRVLSSYIADTREKLLPYQELLGKVELFLSIVNSRFSYSGKELRCDASNGFLIQSKSGKTVPIEMLSSGEQHEVVLNFQLIFGVKENSLVLIDEPEISLHVDWQREFINQIQRIAEVRKHKFLIATHSPQIIDEHWDNTQVLRGDSQAEDDGEISR